jgi:hypothetical protein
MHLDGVLEIGGYPCRLAVAVCEIDAIVDDLPLCWPSCSTRPRSVEPAHN